MVNGRVNCFVLYVLITFSGTGLAAFAIQKNRTVALGNRTKVPYVFTFHFTKMLCDSFLYVL